MYNQKPMIESLHLLSAHNKKNWSHFLYFPMITLFFFTLKKWLIERHPVILPLWQPAIITVSNESLGYITTTQCHQLLHKDKL